MSLSLAPARPRAVFFDLDETLLDDDRSYRKAVSSTVCSLAGLQPEIDARHLERTYLRISADVWTNIGALLRAEAAARPTGAEIRRRVWGEALAACGRPEAPLADAAADLYAGHRRRTYSLFPEVLQVLRRFQGRLKVGVITNGPGDTQREKVSVTGLDRYLDLVVASGDLGVMKPEPAIFALALERAGAAAAEAVHVGDSLTNDVGGALSAGLTAIWINRLGVSRPADAPEPHHEMRSLTQMLPLVGPQALDAAGLYANSAFDTESVISNQGAG